MIHLDIQDMTVSFGSKTVIDHISPDLVAGK